VYQLHAVDPAVPIEESIGALVELREEGKIQHIGICNVSAAELEYALAVTPIVSVQNRYNAVDRGSEPVLELCERLGIAFIPWAPLAGGALSRARGPIRDTARRLGATPAQVALAWLLHRSPLILPIPGTRSAEHLAENARAVALELDVDDLGPLTSSAEIRYGPRRLARPIRAHARRLRRSLREQR
jgi:pyridoxine 4-dehydrogenase